MRGSHATSIAAEFACAGINDAASVILTNPATPATHKGRESQGRYITQNQEQAITEAMAIAMANQSDHIESVRVSRDQNCISRGHI